MPAPPRPRRRSRAAGREHEGREHGSREQQVGGKPLDPVGSDEAVALDQQFRRRVLAEVEELRHGVQEDDDGEPEDDSQKRKRRQHQRPDQAKPPEEEGDRQEVAKVSDEAAG